MSPSTVLMQADEIADARQLISLALTEDLAGLSDITTDSLVPESAQGRVQIVSRAAGVLSGAAVARQVFEQLNPNVRYDLHCRDGAPLQSGTVIATVEGSMRTLLTAERTALNFLTLLSGVASLTRTYVEAVQGTRAVILDTRKTLPGLRRLQKFAVRCGGGQNHRIGLYDAVLIKDNHLAWWLESGHSLADAIREARRQAPEGMIVEVEVDSLAQLQEVLPAGPDIVLLDNMSTAQLSEGLALRDSLAPTVQLEASGGVNLNTVAAIARTGIDRISIGALTHSAPALDIGFDWGG
ncbi:carboxylating nicotinate-nucleotide diphosphorylase [Planctomicrobium sp. SH664]|uniref:carboxylating nicotinate-nucleotide diphosphorylase n=1 Tax=Planctomicrobium sp. SH664 TaxID=3448125 RepID=UPI003F5C5D1A